MNVHAEAIHTALPPIMVAAEQYDQLSAVAGGLENVLPEVAHFLDQELARAEVMPLAQLPADVVTVNATVDFIFGMKGRVERLKLVYPTARSSDDGVVSIASPVGVALLGMREGQTISWSSRHGDMRWLKVVKVIGRA